jgi:predicted nucleic acid-binding Zn ribbon protein
MPQAPTLPLDTAGAVQTPSPGPGRTCENCEQPLTGRQERACSDKCRAILWRQGREAVQAERERKIRDLLVEALQLLEL